MNRVEVMRGKDVSLVMQEKTDIELWYQGMNDLETQLFIGTPGNIFHKETEEEYYEKIRKDSKTRNFSILLNKEQKVIGSIGLFDISERNRNAEYGIVIFDKDEWNKGYGSEATDLILKYGFNVLGLHKIRLYLLRMNERALAMYKNIGFKEIGLRAEEIWIKDRYEDIVLMEIFQNEYIK